MMDAPKSSDGGLVPAVAVSPTDQSSDREQSDADQAGNLGRNLGDRAQSDANQTTNLAMQVEVRDSIDRLAKAIDGDQTAKALDAHRYGKTIRTTVLGSAAVIIVMLAAMIVLAVLELEAVSGSRDARDQIISCVTPGHACFDQSQVRTAQFISRLVATMTGNDQRVAARAAACAPDYISLPPRARTAAIYQCIVRGR